MKINDINPDVKVVSHRGSNAMSENDIAFKALFNSQMVPVDEIREHIDTSDTNGSTKLLEQGDNLLSLLDTYAADLEDPGKMLKHMEPLVTCIETEVSRIQGTVADNAPVDNDLQNLVNELTVTASVAMCKFYRGDFI